MEIPNEKTGDHIVVDWAIEEMNKKRSKPAFIAVGLFRPHIPWEVPKEWFDKYPLDKVDLPKHLKNDLDDAPSGWGIVGR